MDNVDVAIVGGGIGGASLGSVLAKSGLDVLILEREIRFQDRVRGEWIAPWGVTELMTMGLYELLIEAGGHHITRSTNYDEIISPEEAEATSLPLNFHKGIPGPLTIQHVTLQNTALDHSIQAGVVVKRGIDEVEIRAGAKPTVSYLHQGEQHHCHCRLIVGADGRSSTVRRQIGLKLEEDPIDHLIAGLLVEGATDWPEDLQSIGKVGDIHYLIFPQGEGIVRLYADYDIADRNRFAGEHGAANMLAAFNMPCVPNSQSIANATAIGPCRSNPSQDAWVDNPWVDGVVLIGDSAGYNDPILGQGVSVTARDARMVGEILTQSSDWTSGMFIPYGEERKERLRRLRMVARFVTTLNARFGPEADLTRARGFKRMANNPALRGIALAAFSGPETLDAQYFEQAHWDKVFA
jgi:2-polyprenyl-6-methoxyphenol hydroxylase-like FAD-dependent oxidoreductase